MMNRHSSLLATTLVLSLLSPLKSAIAQSTWSEPLAATDVVYIVVNSGIETYNVDPKTGIAVPYGITQLPAVFDTVVPSINDHFVYVYSYSIKMKTTKLWAYATDSNGVPQTPAVQTMSFNPAISTFMIDPDGTLAYAAQEKQNSQDEPLAGIRAFAVNPETGVLTEFPKLSATYPLNGPCRTGTFAGGSFELVGFNPTGSQLYDEWFCTDYDSVSTYYYTRRVNQQTGALGPDAATVTGGGANIQSWEVAITPSSILETYSPGFCCDNDEVSVFPLSGGTNPVFTCTTSMLAACGDGADAVDRSGKYVFLGTPSGDVVTLLDLAEKKLIKTDHWLTDSIKAISLDDKLVYGWQDESGTVPIYVFDPANGSVSYNGGGISVANPNFTLVPALRY